MERENDALGSDRCPERPRRPGPAPRQASQPVRSRRAFVPCVSGLESRELLAPASTAVVHVGPFPKAPPGDFGTVSHPTLVQNPDVPVYYNPLWGFSREYSYGSSLRERFFL